MDESGKINKFKQSIDKQIASNKGKNIFVENPKIFQFISETVDAIAKMDELNADSEHLLVDYATDKALNEFCRVNQYFSFDSKSKAELRNIYSELFENFKSKSVTADDISKEHYENLRKWLHKHNSFAEEIYSKTHDIIDTVACSEYSPELQIQLLQIDLKKIKQPLLDIGCGSNGLLVNYLRNKGIEAVGIDRMKFKQPNLITTDWLEFDYGIEKWGTIVSNLGFSNHFIHHNLREDGNYIEYGKTFMNILVSLKVGGSFHYAPDLPFIEKYLDPAQFSMRKNIIDLYDFKASIIEKLK